MYQEPWLPQVQGTLLLVMVADIHWVELVEGKQVALMVVEAMGAV